MPKLRLEITKDEAIRYISHLDYARTLERTIRRAKLPVAYSEGFNPHMKLSFASALAVGITSDAEYVDIEFTEAVQPETIVFRLLQRVPQGIRIQKAKSIPERGQSLMASVNLAAFTIDTPLLPDKSAAMAYHSLESFNRAEQIFYTKESPKGRRVIDVKQFLLKKLEIAVTGGRIKVKADIKITPIGSIKPSDILQVLVEQFTFPADKNAALINRDGLYILAQQGKLTPLDI
ncbi:hypothetical protein P22_3585 [Propionispora sp. 2/2-37]|uniref:TIGR03936 family radical SAM-associated protein n=1 Tax=Propionispora sp. 2/2-37 TaxID=1677858 RepID=UPI0006BB9585|nr:TIGR03936 family radical SAM-associated protein [Propionispora sp. 2/2-37]CUH97455.1 hypothetical protein P22_3585 [Propionispora sp. 2/2-37]